MVGTGRGRRQKRREVVILYRICIDEAVFVAIRIENAGTIESLDAGGLSAMLMQSNNFVQAVRPSLTS